MYKEDSITTLMEEEDVLLPDGWQEGVDLFSLGDGESEPQTDEFAQALCQDPEEVGAADEPAPTPEQDEAAGDHGARQKEAPTTEPGSEGRANKLRFKARVDRKDRDVELDESELPTVYQKAQVTDRVQARLAALTPRLERAEQMAKKLGYEGLDNMLSSAENTWRHKEAGRPAEGGEGGRAAGETAARRADGQSAAPARDFRGEARALLQARPDLKGRAIPDAVVKDCVGGKHLLAAYAEYEVRQEKAEADRLRRENEVLRQNAASAARAPISGTLGGGAADTKPKDDFLKGFDEEA